MRARIPWIRTAAQNKAMMDEIRRQTIIADRDHYLDIVAMVLWALHIHKPTRYGRKRLKAFYKDFSKIHQELLDYYELYDHETSWIAHYKLKEIGVDVHQWYKEEQNE